MGTEVIDNSLRPGFPVFPSRQAIPPMPKPNTRLSDISRRCVLVALACLGGVAQAEGGGFEPVPRSPAQVVQTIEGRMIVAASGVAFEAGASLETVSGRRAWLAVSIRNMRAEPVALGDDAIRASAGGESLTLVDVETPEPEQEPVTDKCANASMSSQVNCGIDAFTQRQQDRVAHPAAVRIDPGQVLARQFEVTLPKKSRKSPSRITVSIVVEGETLEFDFDPRTDATRQ